VAQELGIQKVIAGVPANQKGQVIMDLQQGGSNVAMIGDGINDAHALAQANAGIALASGTDIAMSSADVTLLGNGLENLPLLFRISLQTMKTVQQNLFWAFIYNIIAIPIAAGALYPLTGTLLNPMIAGGAMALSSISVMVNSLWLKFRLN
jgi:Cu2+-exporting ATPase